MPHLEVIVIYGDTKKKSNFLLSLKGVLTGQKKCIALHGHIWLYVYSY